LRRHTREEHGIRDQGSGIRAEAKNVTNRFPTKRVVVVVATIVVCALAGAACRPSSPLRVTTIQTGKSLNSDKSVGIHTTRFKPDDTMFASVLTDGPGTGTIGVRWRFGGRVVSEETKEVSYRDHAATEFHIQNSSGFPVGEYTVEVLVDGDSFATRSLRVEK
jgi:hypothetical protein